MASDSGPQGTAYRLEFFPTMPERPGAIWCGEPGRGGRLVAVLRDTGCTMEEARTMVAALNGGKRG